MNFITGRWFWPVAILLAVLLITGQVFINVNEIKGALQK